MMTKKNPNLELEGKRKIFLQVGLLAVGSLTLAAFTYKRPSAIDDEKRLVVHRVVEFQEEVIEKPKPIETKPEIQKELPPQKEDPQQTIDVQRQVSDLIKALLNKQKTVKSDVSVGGVDKKFGDIKFDLDDDLKGEIIEMPDVDAQFIGGYVAMKTYIGNEVEYPEISRRFGEQGTVWIAFVVEKDGSLTGMKVERGVSTDLDKEALRVARTFKKWQPGEVQGLPVRTRVRLPITFVLEP